MLMVITLHLYAPFFSSNFMRVPVTGLSGNISISEYSLRANTLLAIAAYSMSVIYWAGGVIRRNHRGRH